MSEGKKPDAKELLYDLIAALPKCYCGEPAQWETESSPRAMVGSHFSPCCHHHGHNGYCAKRLPHADALQAAFDAFSFCELKRLGFVLRAP